MTDFGSLRDHLVHYGQEHLVEFWDKLSDSERNELMGDINEIDFEAAVANFQHAKEAKKIVFQKLEPVPEFLQCGVEKSSPAALRTYEQRTFELISKSKLAVLVLAGGQGTRLGVPYPKGG